MLAFAYPFLHFLQPGILFPELAPLRPMQVIAAELGYASASAFTAMVTRTVGMPPSRFFGHT